MDTRQVKITYHKEDGAWWAESDDMPGFSAAGDTFAETRKLAREDIPFYFDDGKPTQIREFLDSGAEVVPDNSMIILPSPYFADNDFTARENIGTTANQGILERQVA